MYIDFSRVTDSIKGKFMHVHKLLDSEIMKFTKTIKKMLTRLKSPNATFVSLVDKGANKNPFMVEQSVAAVPNYSPAGSNNKAHTTSIKAIKVTSIDGETKLTKSVINQIESQLGVDLSDATITVDQGILISMGEDTSESTWMDLDLKGTDYKMSFAVSTEVNQEADTEVEEFEAVSEQILEALASGDKSALVAKVEEAYELLHKQSEPATISNTEVDMTQEDNLQPEVVVDQASEPEVEVEVVQEAAEAQPEEAEVVEEATPVEEAPAEVKVDQSTSDLHETLRIMASSIAELTKQVAELKVKEVKEVEQSAEPTIQRAMPSTSGSAAVSAPVEVQQSAESAYSRMSVEERAEYLRKYR